MTSTDPVVINQGKFEAVNQTIEITKTSIQYIDSSDLKGTNKFVDNSFQNSTGATITLPSAAGTLATTADVSSLRTVVESGTMTLSNKTLTEPEIAAIKNGGTTISIPTTSGTFALTADVNGADETIHNNINTLQKEINYLAARLEGTLEYLRQWSSAGNLVMSDIKTVVDGAVTALMTPAQGE